MSSGTSSYDLSPPIPVEKKFLEAKERLIGFFDKSAEEKTAQVAHEIRIGFFERGAIHVLFLSCSSLGCCREKIVFRIFINALDLQKLIFYHEKFKCGEFQITRTHSRRNM